MSQRALCLAVRDRIQKRLGFDEGTCDVQPPPGKPPAFSGEIYVAVWEAGVTNDATESRDDRHMVNVTLTRHVTVAPDDREAKEIIHRLVIGLEVLADQVASLIHGDLQGTGGGDVADNYAILNGANNYLKNVMPVGATYYGFVEPLRFLGMGRTEEKGADWFSGDPQEGGKSGRAITLNFGKSRRLQSVFLQT